MCQLCFVIFIDKKHSFNDKKQKHDKINFVISFNNILASFMYKKKSPKNLSIRGLFHCFLKISPIVRMEMFLFEGANPVSYTHLDVYKRQLLMVFNNLPKPSNAKYSH